MKIIPKIGFCTCYHPFEESADKAPEIFEKSLALLRSSGEIEVVSAEKLINDVETAILVSKQFKREQVDVICVKLATWSSDNPILDMNSEYDVPFVFWTYSHMHAGSLCGGQQFNMIFKELNKECIFVYKDDEAALNKIKTYCKCVALKNELRTTRFLRLGNRTQGMAEVICDELSVKEVLGPRIVSLGLDDFKQLVEGYPEDEALILWRDLKDRVGKISVDDRDGIKAVKNYLAMKKLIESGLLSGVTIECYPRYMGEACLGFSLLADDGIPGACEGDVNSLILMHIMMRLSGKPVHNIDPLYLSDEDNTLTGSHCGCGSFSNAASNQDIEFANVRLANNGLCVLFPSKPGKITMANLVGRKGTYRMSVIEGEAIDTDLIFPGNPIKIKLPISIENFLNQIEEFGIGHHWIIAYGNFKDELRRLSSLFKIKFIGLR